MKKKFFYFIILISLTSCGTFRNFGDEEVSKITDGVRTMTSNLCWTASGCAASAVSKAKEECVSENKKYEYVSHNVFFGFRISYRCK